MSRIFNLGSGNGFSVREVVERVNTFTKRTVPIILSERRAGDCAILVSGSDRASSELGWKPEFSTLDQIIRDALQWHQHGTFYE